MAKKNKTDSNGLVYSTDPDFRFEEKEESVQTLPPAQQPLTIRRETKHRAGKIVTLVLGFVGSPADAELLGRQLRNACGSGGSVKEGEIIVQGDHREKVWQYLQKNGYSRTRKPG
ncbi:MAG TPA: translation initiation factor [Lacibacter sp.]|nr:translation initiation factor [Lacibacter sp.]HMO88722.1 translation initiation factor [Lacibacter sp.]HMP88490.1 translation initiation factor [Lacibacter sp.]